MTTGMTKAERWYEVARRVAGGAIFSYSVRDVFCNNPSDIIGNTEWANWDWTTYVNDEYDNHYVMLALFLAYEAEDEESEVPEPVMLLATEEPVSIPHCQTVTALHGHVETFATSGGVMFWEANVPAVKTASFMQSEPSPVERRSPWNAKLADGMRKWADWMEARF